MGNEDGEPRSWPIAGVAAAVSVAQEHCATVLSSEEVSAVAIARLKL